VYSPSLLYQHFSTFALLAHQYRRENPFEFQWIVNNVTVLMISMFTAVTWCVLTSHPSRKVDYPKKVRSSRTSMLAVNPTMENIGDSVDDVILVHHLRERSEHTDDLCRTSQNWT
jgi:hypothetical protein